MSSPLTMPHVAPAFAGVRLRAFTDRDVDMVLDLSTDLSVPKIGTLPGDAGGDEALAYVARQHDRLSAGAGYSIAPRSRGRGLAAQALAALTRSAGPSPNCGGSSSTSSRGTSRRCARPNGRATSERV